MLENVSPVPLIFSPKPCLLEMAMGTRNPSTRRVLPDKDTSMELYFYPRVHKWQHHVPIGQPGAGVGTYYPYPHTRG
jgi:hypothetical protein